MNVCNMVFVDICFREVFFLFSDYEDVIDAVELNSRIQFNGISV